MTAEPNRKWIYHAARPCLNRGTTRAFSKHCTLIVILTRCPMGNVVVCKV